MAVLVGNDTYKRWVIDPEEGEIVFVVAGKSMTPEEYVEAREKDPELVLEDLTIAPNEDARKIMVTFRPLRAGDKYAIQDLSNDTGQVAAGSGRRQQIKRAVVGWDFDVPWSEAVLDNLDVSVEAQIFAWISWGVEPPEQDPETGRRIIPPTEEGTKEPEKKQPAASSSPKTKT